MQISQSTFLYLLLAIVATIWGFVGTVLVRWSCVVLKQFLGQGQTPRGRLQDRTSKDVQTDAPHAVSMVPDDRGYLDNSFKVPKYTTAFGLVLVNTFVLWIALVIAGTFSGPAGDGPESKLLFLLRTLSLSIILAVPFLTWINREILGTTWLIAATITAAYLLGTAFVTAILFVVLIAGSGPAR